MNISSTSSSAGTPQKVDTSLASQFALRVALQTMKERCVTLQQRLSAIELENVNLRTHSGVDAVFPPAANYKKVDESENQVLREKVSELQRQKIQLTDHIAMVATENRQLWSRLSDLTKEKNKVKKSVPENTSNQNLIRSKTFTQHSPSPLLRQKHMPGDSNKSPDDLSLEEVSLKALNEFMEVKAEIEKKCEEFNGSDCNSLGFGYLNDETTDGDITLEAKKCNDGMHDIKNELLKQQGDLKFIMAAFGKKQAIQEECAECKKRKEKPQMADKNLETDDTLLEINTKSVGTSSSASSSSSQNKETTIISSPKPKSEDIYVTENVPMDILEMKRKADIMNKMCPMCGKIYSSATPFDEFSEHVEMHFIDDSELETSIDKNFEFISSTVGNF